MALADASLFQPFFPSPLVDVQLYQARYGFHPNFVWENQTSTKFLEILDWQGALKTVCNANGIDPNTPGSDLRQRRFEAFASRISSNQSLWNVESLNSNLGENREKLYTEIRKEHNEAMSALRSYKR